MNTRKNIKKSLLILLVLTILLAFSACNIKLSEDEFELAYQLKDSYKYTYSIVNMDQNIDGKLTFMYMTQNNGTTKLQTLADFETWIYKAQIVFDTKTLKPSSSYKSNIFYSGTEEDWSVDTTYTEQEAKILAVQGEKTMEKKVKTPARYLDNEMVNLTIGLIKLDLQEQVDINVLINESAIFAPYALVYQKDEEVQIGDKTYDCIKYSAKYARFSLFGAKESLLWYTNDSDRILVKYESGSQIMTLEKVEELSIDSQWLFDK